MFTCATILTGGLMLFSLKLHPAPRPVTSGLWPHPPLCSPFLCPLHFLGRRAEWWWGPLGGDVGRTRGGGALSLAVPFVFVLFLISD